jgi:hypothetical protein
LFNVHSKNEFGSPKVFDVKFLLYLRLEVRRIAADDYEVVNVGVDPGCYWFRPMEDAGVGEGCLEANAGKEDGKPFVSYEGGLLESIDCLFQLKDGVWRAIVSGRGQECDCVLQRAREEGAPYVQLVYFKAVVVGK